MEYYGYKDLMKSIAHLYQQGGLFQKIADKAYAVAGRIQAESQQELDPFEGLQFTKHGESRIEHCWKYDLGHGCRLVTICDNGIHVLCYVGDHASCDKWIDKNRGLRLTVDKKNQVVPMFTSRNINDETLRISTETDLSLDYLCKRISGRYLDKIWQNIPFSISSKLSALTGTSTEHEIEEIANKIEDQDKKIVFYDVFCKLRQGDFDEAVKSIELYTDNLMRLEEMEANRAGDLRPGEDLVDLRALDPTLLEHYMKSTNFKQWMLYLHPDQQVMVEKDFAGPVKLMGVSGSGKTSVIVSRAIKLAHKYAGEKILVLTLNKALARLIEELINQACPESFRRDIVVSSFWTFCQDQLKVIDPGGANSYDELTWKTNEHIDEIWDEFFECKHNNNEAKVLMPVNKSLLARSIFPKDYIKQEFDWIRSALAATDRRKYVDIDREGRVEALSKEYRSVILQALEAWESKMKAVGATDYLGIASALRGHLPMIKPEYRCVLVDEVQDFGTTELQIIRKLTDERENDIFLCGDIAQQVYTKHRKLKQAGINVSGRSYIVKKNYRNSREILAAAYSVLRDNVDISKLDTEEFQILEPEFANFSTPRPLLLKADSIDEEFGRAYHYLKNTLGASQKGCICFCGYSLVDVKKIGDKIGLPVLDGNVAVEGNSIFLSDLEQAKGFEFDTVCIINCTKSVIPDPMFPIEEWYRDISKFYVAMTRAKLSLIVSYSGAPSVVLANTHGNFIMTDWKTHEEQWEIEGFSVPAPVRRKSEEAASFLDMTGEEFLYARSAVGISRDLSDKLPLLLTGEKVSRTIDGVVMPRSWKNVSDVLDEKNVVALRQRFGSQDTLDEFKQLFPDYKPQDVGGVDRETVQEVKQMAIETKIKGNKLIITCNLEEPTPSASGKTLVVASTRGNMRTTLTINGKPLTIGFNAYIHK